MITETKTTTTTVTMRPHKRHTRTSRCNACLWWLLVATVTTAIEETDASSPFHASLSSSTSYVSTASEERSPRRTAVAGVATTADSITSPSSYTFSSRIHVPEGDGHDGSSDAIETKLGEGEYEDEHEYEYEYEYEYDRRMLYGGAQEERLQSWWPYTYELPTCIIGKAACSDSILERLRYALAAEAKMRRDGVLWNLGGYWIGWIGLALCAIGIWFGSWEERQMQGRGQRQDQRYMEGKRTEGDDDDDDDDDDNDLEGKGDRPCRFTSTSQSEKKNRGDKRKSRKSADGKQRYEYLSDQSFSEDNDDDDDDDDNDNDNNTNDDYNSDDEHSNHQNRDGKINKCTFDRGHEYRMTTTEPTTHASSSCSKSSSSTTTVITTTGTALSSRNIAHKLKNSFISYWTETLTFTRPVATFKIFLALLLVWELNGVMAPEQSMLATPELIDLVRTLPKTHEYVPHLVHWSMPNLRSKNASFYVRKLELARIVLILSWWGYLILPPPTHSMTTTTTHTRQTARVVPFLNKLRSHPWLGGILYAIGAVLYVYLGAVGLMYNLAHSTQGGMLFILACIPAVPYLNTDARASAWMRKMLYASVLIPIYLFSGVSKVRYEGVAWNLNGRWMWAAFNTQHVNRAVLDNLFLWIHEHKWTMMIMSWGNLFLELLLPLTLIVFMDRSIVLRSVFHCTAFFFHLTIFFLLGPNFARYVLMHLLASDPFSWFVHGGCCSRLWMAVASVRRGPMLGGSGSNGARRNIDGHRYESASVDSASTSSHVVSAVDEMYSHTNVNSNTDADAGATVAATVAAAADDDDATTPATAATVSTVDWIRCLVSTGAILGWLYVQVDSDLDHLTGKTKRLDRHNPYFPIPELSMFASPNEPNFTLALFLCVLSVCLYVWAMFYVSRIRRCPHLATSNTTNSSTSTAVMTTTTITARGQTAASAVAIGSDDHDDGIDDTSSEEDEDYDDEEG